MFLAGDALNPRQALTMTAIQHNLKHVERTPGATLFGGWPMLAGSSLRSDRSAIQPGVGHPDQGCDFTASVEMGPYTG